MVGWEKWQRKETDEMTEYASDCWLEKRIEAENRRDIEEGRKRGKEIPHNHKWSVLKVISSNVSFLDEICLLCDIHKMTPLDVDMHIRICDRAENALNRTGGGDPRSFHAIDVKRAWLKGLATEHELFMAQKAAKDAAIDKWGMAEKQRREKLRLWAEYGSWEQTQRCDARLVGLNSALDAARLAVEASNSGTAPNAWRGQVKMESDLKRQNYREFWEGYPLGDAQP